MTVYEVYIYNYYVMLCFSLSCVVCLELPLLFLLLVGSLAVSINSTLGLALACKGFRDSGSEGR